MKATFPRMHVSLYVADITKTVEFYQSFFGIKAEKVKADYAKFILEKPSLVLTFVQNEALVHANFGHLGFQVETKERMEVLLGLARGQGIVDKEEIGTACCYAIQDKFWVKDPDGYQWEVYFFHEDAEFNDPHYSKEEATACCTPPVVEEVKEETSCCTPSSGCC